MSKNLEIIELFFSNKQKKDDLGSNIVFTFEPSQAKLSNFRKLGIKELGLAWGITLLIRNSMKWNLIRDNSLWVNKNLSLNMIKNLVI